MRVVAKSNRHQWVNALSLYSIDTECDNGADAINPHLEAHMDTVSLKKYFSYFF